MEKATMNITQPPALQTERLLLRKFTDKDVNALFHILSDIKVNTFLPWFPLKSQREAAVFYEKNYKKIYDEKNGYAYAVCLKKDNLPIGYIKISGDAHDLGYGLLSEFWHNGIITEAGKAVVAQAKRDGLPFITATHDRNNPRSGSVMRNCGMTYRYSFREQWQPKDISVVFRMYQLNLNIESDYLYDHYKVIHNGFIETDLSYKFRKSHMKINIVKNRTPQAIHTLLDIWENSVKATHKFLSDSEIEKIKPYVPKAIKHVQNLVVAENENNTPVAFMGIENQKIEMLFIAPEERGKGIGKSLIQYAVNDFSANEVTVNEQNTQAVGFYKHMGFETYKRTEFDEQGNAYPLLYMNLKEPSFHNK